MDFSFDIEQLLSPINIALLGVSFATCLYISIIYRKAIMRVTAKARGDNHENIPAKENVPPISVIVYDRDNYDTLAQMLGNLLEQEYAAPFEIIVATDGRSLAAEETVGSLAVNHRNIRLTFVPDEAHALSRKKLALTLGIKAARYDYILLTDASVRSESKYWLKKIGELFAEGYDVVVGHSYLVDEAGGPEKGFRAYDSLADAAAALYGSISGHPFRTNEANLAFRKQLFFDLKGFSDSFNYHYGIDDIFFSRLAKDKSLGVTLSGDSYAPTACYDIRKSHRIEKLRHVFTGRRTGHLIRRIFGGASASMWLSLASTIALVALNPYEPVAALISLVFGIIWLTFTLVSWRKCSRALDIPINLWLTPIYMLIRPISNFIYRIKARKSRSRNFTWTARY